jgi:predicted transcriptional regulator
MKPSNFLSIRIDPNLKDAAEKVLESGESLTSFVEHSIRYQIRRRNLQRTFIERGLAAAAEAKHSDKYYSTEEVLAELDQIIDAQQHCQ